MSTDVCLDTCSFICTLHSLPSGPVTRPAPDVLDTLDFDPPAVDVADGPCPWEP